MKATELITEQPFVPVNRGFTYKGYPCTKDCSGHMAGDAWADKKGIQTATQCPPGWSNSFWEGCKSNSEYTAEDLEQGLRVDVPNEEWLQGKIDYAKSRGRNSYGVPYLGTGTAYISRVVLPVSLLKNLPGMRAEQQNVRQEDLAAIMKTMKDTGKLPLGRSGEEYLPFINVAYNGEAWVNEGNHRIMAAARLGWDRLPVELRYFDGGERIKSGPLYPKKIGLGDLTETDEQDLTALKEACENWMEMYFDANDINTILNHPYSQQFKKPPANIDKLYRGLVVKGGKIKSVPGKSNRKFVAYATHEYGAEAFLASLEVSGRKVIVEKQFNPADFLFDFTGLYESLFPEAHILYNRYETEYEVWMRATSYYTSVDEKEIVSDTAWGKTDDDLPGRGNL